MTRVLQKQQEKPNELVYTIRSISTSVVKLSPASIGNKERTQRMVKLPC
jgi:hypothetical protein